MRELPVHFRSLILAACLILCGAGWGGGARAADKASAPAPAPQPGHSSHGEVFSVGPRSAAYLMNGCGDIHFPLTCKSKEAEAFFNQGIGQFHGFWYYEAERSFRTAAAIDPSCVMAYWGMAMANIHNLDRGRDFIKEALKRKDSAHLNPIELAWIDATSEFFLPQSKGSRPFNVKTLMATLKEMNRKFPDDVEIKAFLVYFIMENTGKEDFALADRLLNEIFAVTPGHPARHYRMHVGDGPGHAKAGLESARLIGPGAPSLPHMWHMPGMAYGGYGRAADGEWASEAADRVQHQYTMRSFMMPFQDSWSTHYDEYLITTLLTVGRVHDAMKLATSMIDLPRPPQGQGEAPAGMERLIDTLSMHQMWDEYLAMCASGYLSDDLEITQRIRKLRYEGVASAVRGRPDAAAACIAKLETERRNLPAPPARKSVSVAISAVIGGAGARLSAMQASPAEKLFAERLTAIEQAISHIKAQEALGAGDFTLGIELLTAAAEPKEHIALACLAAGDFARAQQLANQAGGNQPYPLATRVLVLHRINKKMEAAKAFAALRDVSDGIDLSVQPYKSLCEIAPQYGFKTDYRMPRKVSDDVAGWPPLDSLGPFLWHPTPAPAWSAPSADGSTLSLSQYRGKPLILLFYLGHGCPHCVLQIHDFATVTRQFADAGISLLAIGTDTPDTLSRTWAKAKISDDPLMFPLVSDVALDIFKKYHCYDDFENSPLHGTFLIDGQGLIRWLDIGPEPFLNTTFLLKEAKRLLAQKAAS